MMSLPPSPRELWLLSWVSLYRGKQKTGTFARPWYQQFWIKISNYAMCSSFSKSLCLESNYFSSTTVVSSLSALVISVMHRVFHTYCCFSKSAVEFHLLALLTALSSPQVTPQSDPLPSSHKSSQQPLQGIQANLLSHSHSSFPLSRYTIQHYAFISVQDGNMMKKWIGMKEKKTDSPFTIMNSMFKAGFFSLFFTRHFYYLIDSFMCQSLDSFIVHTSSVAPLSWLGS